MIRTPPYRQIVVGVDGSAASAAAVRWAVREARLHRAAVRIVCAYHRSASLCAPYASWCRMHQDERYAAAKALLDGAADLASRRLPPERLVTELVDEPPVRALLDRSVGAEMLVLGTSRPPVQPGQPPLAMGPVARICLRRARCPVVVVAPDDLPDEPARQRTSARRISSAPQTMTGKGATMASWPGESAAVPKKPCRAGR
jgi:nucleotide-binding universal stress UspA family protein